MKRTLYIHVGPSKTGTSAFQHVLSQHDNSVVIYPKVGLWSDGSHHNLVLNFLGNYNHAETVCEDIRSLFGRICAEARQSGKPVVISSEILSDDFCDTGEFVRALHASLGDEFRVVILFVVRQHYDRAKSYYAQCVADPFIGERREPGEFLTESLSALSYAPVLRRLLKTGFDIRLLNYEPAREVVPSLMRNIGFFEGHIPPPPVRHQSLCTMALIALLTANRFSAPQDLKEKIRDRIVRLPDFNGPLRSIFGDAAVLTVEPVFNTDRAFLSDNFGFYLPAPVLTAEESGFWLSAGEYSELVAAVADLGPEIGDYREMLREFVRPGS